MDEKHFVVEMNEFAYAAKEPEGHIHAENVMGIYSNPDQTRSSNSTFWVVWVGTHNSKAAKLFEVSDETCWNLNLLEK